ncbi:MAG: ABC transporter substrate-binding protein [Bradyrhizobium sp.]|nr:ABC transporter substrate-binding protein [Bradyrhizobium sp.]
MAYAPSDPVAQGMVAAFRDGLAKLGWREGDNLRIEVRWGEGDAEKFSAFAKELIGLRPEVIASMGTIASGFVVRETKTIPIVFVGPVDAIGSGLVTNLAHPGGNVTGFTMNMTDLGGKWIELLKEIAPSTTHVALLAHPATGPSLQLFMPSIQTAAQSFGIAVTAAPIQAENEIEGVIADQAREAGGGLIVTPSAFSSVHRELIIALAARYRLPAMYHERKFTDQGGLIAYIPDYAEGWRPAAGYVDRILRGANPGDLPVQASAKFDLFINAKTAKALGLAVPPTLLATADEVIE